MAKRHGRHARGGRVTPKGTRPRNFKGGEHPHQQPEPDEPDLLGETRRRLREEHPLAFLAYVSSLYAAWDPRDRNPFDRGTDTGPTREELIESFLDVDRIETSALLSVIAELVDSELVRARIRGELQRRSHPPLPPWVTQLGAVDAYRTVEQVHVLGDGDNVLLGVRLPGGAEMTVFVYIDHNLGGVAKDAFVVDEPIADLIAFMREKVGDDSGDTRWDDFDPADARARITEAIERGAITFPRFESDTWPACRPLVEWIARLLPEGGRGYEQAEWSDEALHEIAQRFLESPFAAGLTADEDYADLLDPLLWFGSAYGPCDPFHWSPVAVEILLSDWIPRKIVAPAPYLAKAPDLLRAFIRFAHHERGIRAPLTAETLDAVDYWEPGYQEVIRSPRPQGPMALLAAMEAFDPDGPWGGDARSEFGDEPLPDWPSTRGLAAADAPDTVIECAGSALVLDRFRILAEFYGEGRKLTQTGNPTLAGARTLIGLLGTGDRMDRSFGDRTFRTTSAAELPELMFTLRWAVAAGVLRKEHGKLIATTSWARRRGGPLDRWLRTVGALVKLEPLETYFARARFRGSGEAVDEFAPSLVHSLVDGPVAFDAALDRPCSWADWAYEWRARYMQDPEHRRQSLGFDLDLLVEILVWAGVVERSGATEEPDEWIPETVRRTGGSLALTDAGRWWVTGGTA